ncbi:MAG TPA: saccharopine dehydrogenase C-terminal domain-containing protein [Candidatus Angelobacter sp.]|nr:saccharopine dehydrogenase C-terminal domain-containing protein [Candidatus Angelobacter sp.]
MRLLVIGSGMMGSAAAFDMARSNGVESVTLADVDKKRVREAAKKINQLAGTKKVKAVEFDAGKPGKAGKLMRGHNGVLSAVPYFFNLGLCQAAIASGCHFADLGGNNTVVRQEYALSKKAEKKKVAIAPDCGLSPGMASILAGELMRRVGGKAEALKIYVGGLPQTPKPPFFYHLVFSVEGLINEYVEPAKVLRQGKIQEIEPLTEPEEFVMKGFDNMVAFHTSGGTSTLPETFKGKVGECFEKTLRYPSHFQLVRGLYDLGFFSSKKITIGKTEIAPRAITSKMFLEKLSSHEPDVTVMRIEAHTKDRVASFSMVDHHDSKTGMTSMMRTTAWPASVVLQMICSGKISRRGGVYQETDVPASEFLQEMENRNIPIESAERPA